jgi:serine/threonine protein kinase
MSLLVTSRPRHVGYSQAELDRMSERCVAPQKYRFQLVDGKATVLVAGGVRVLLIRDSFLGAGADKYVKYGCDLSTRRLWAVGVVRKDPSRTVSHRPKGQNRPWETRRQAALNEGRVAAALHLKDHVHVPTAVLEADHKVYTISPLAEADYYEISRSRLSMAQKMLFANRAARDVLAGLCALHEVGLVHTDLHAGNIFFMNPYCVMLADLGRAQQLPRDQKVAASLRARDFQALFNIVTNVSTNMTCSPSIGFFFRMMLNGEISPSTCLHLLTVREGSPMTRLILEVRGENSSSQDQSRPPS